MTSRSTGSPTTSSPPPRRSAGSSATTTRSVTSAAGSSSGCRRRRRRRSSRHSTATMRTSRPGSYRSVRPAADGGRRRRSRRPPRLVLHFDRNSHGRLRVHRRPQPAARSPAAPSATARPRRREQWPAPPSRPLGQPGGSVGVVRPGDDPLSSAVLTASNELAATSSYRPSTVRRQKASVRPEGSATMSSSTSWAA